MPFTYRVDVDLPELMSERLIAHFSELNFRLVESDDNKWVFVRGHYMAFLYQFDICAYATTLRVRTTRINAEELHVVFDYEIFTFLAIPSSEDITRLEEEVAQFVAKALLVIGDPREHMTTSRLPGQLLPLWLVIFLIILVPALVVGVASWAILTFAQR